jgi:hypothetical protein
MLRDIRRPDAFGVFYEIGQTIADRLDHRSVLYGIVLNAVDALIPGIARWGYFKKTASHGLSLMKRRKRLLNGRKPRGRIVVDAAAKARRLNRVVATQGYAARDCGRSRERCRISMRMAHHGSDGVEESEFGPTEIATTGYAKKELVRRSFKATLNKSLLALFSGRESEVNSDSLPPSPSLA